MYMNFFLLKKGIKIYVKGVDSNLHKLPFDRNRTRTKVTKLFKS